MEVTGIHSDQSESQCQKWCILPLSMNDHPTSTSEDMEISVLASYDDLIRNNKVLTAGSEEKFLEYVVGSERSRRIDGNMQN